MELYSHSQETLLFAHHPEAWMLVNAKSVDRFPAWLLVEVGRGTWLRHKLGVETFANFVCGSWEEENRWRLCHLHHSLDSRPLQMQCAHSFLSREYGDWSWEDWELSSISPSVMKKIEVLSSSSHSDGWTCLHSRQAQALFHLPLPV